MSAILDLVQGMKELEVNNQCAEKLFKENCYKNDLKNPKPAHAPISIKSFVKPQKKKGKSQPCKKVVPERQSKKDVLEAKIKDLQWDNNNLRSQLEVFRKILDDTEGFCANIIKHHTNNGENVFFKRWQRDALCLSRKVFQALRMPKLLPRHKDDDDDDFGGKKKTKTPLVNLENCFRPGSTYEDPSDSKAGADSYESFKAILDAQDSIHKQDDKKSDRKRERNKKNRNKEAPDNASHDEKAVDENSYNKEARNKHDFPEGENCKQADNDMNEADKKEAPDNEKPGNKTFGNGVPIDLGFFGKTPFKKTTLANEPHRRERRVKGGRPFIYHEEKVFPRDVCLSKRFKKQLKPKCNNRQEIYVTPADYSYLPSYILSSI